MSENFNLPKFIEALLSKFNKEKIERFSKKDSYFWIKVMMKNEIILTNKEAFSIKEKLVEQHHKNFNELIFEALKKSGYVDETYKTLESILYC